ncbi:hypothetical protein QKD28_gp5 [Wenling hoplichthys paramyxovirus]|uniref:Uncharacterized protein n=1 Tax=Wenling hoplichthys paramyxovirus TaxID=2116453 RepID=A0A2P1GN18_9MONO|nr:hypothetical protein QKD28_gp5 [Wenling hoplichthys paramyxovirus]AVM87396.1 hypothetical protein [Wenling hoplichthys paramyxovirus]
MYHAHYDDSKLCVLYTNEKQQGVIWKIKQDKRYDPFNTVHRIYPPSPTNGSGIIARCIVCEHSQLNFSGVGSFKDLFFGHEVTKITGVEKKLKTCSVSRFAFDESKPSICTGKMVTSPADLTKGLLVTRFRNVVTFWNQTCLSPFLDLIPETKIKVTKVGLHIKSDIWETRTRAEKCKMIKDSSESTEARTYYISEGCW